MFLFFIVFIVSIEKLLLVKKCVRQEKITHQILAVRISA